MKLKDLYENYQLKKSDNVVSTKDYTILEYDDCLISIKQIEEMFVYITPISLLDYEKIDETLDKLSTNITGKTKFNMMIDYFQIVLSMKLKDHDRNNITKIYDIFSKKYNFNGYTNWYIPSINEIPDINQIDKKHSFITMDFKSSGNILEHAKGKQTYDRSVIINSLVMRHDK